MSPIHTSEQWFVVVNPVSGNGTARRQWLEVAQLLTDHGFQFEMAYTTAKGDAIRLTSEAIAVRGFRKIIAFGGDGTGHEVINGIFSQHIVPTVEITYALIPCGTGNDWVREYGIPSDPKVWIPKIKTLKTIQQDIGYVEYMNLEGVRKERYFTNVAGMAYDGFVARASEAQKRLMGNKLFYLFLVFKCLFDYTFSRVRLQFDGSEQLEGEFYTINVGVCRFSGGGMQIVPHALPSDGLLALTLAGKISKLGVLAATPKFYNGKIGQHPKVITRQISHLKVETLSGAPTLLELDGEFLGQTPLEIKVLSRALRVVVP